MAIEQYKWLVPSILCALAFFSSVGVVWWYKEFARRRGIMDEPNHRSSHTIATPRGGGLGIFVATLPVLTYAAIRIDEPNSWPVVILYFGVPLAILGLLDDLYSLRARFRLLVQLLAASGAVYWALKDLGIPLTVTYELAGGVGFVLTVLYLVWMTNLYNFMDGIDGMAGAHGILFGVAIFGCAWADGAEVLASVGLAFACANAGFLVFNWSPAKIFMGDAGSLFLGFSYAAIGLWASADGVVALPSFLILTGVFVVDTTWTLCRRLAARQNILKAHRDHGFQHAVRLGNTHAVVASGYAVMTVFVLAPIAIATRHHPVAAWAALGVTYTGLGLIAARLQAGVFWDHVPTFADEQATPDDENSTGKMRKVVPSE